MKIPRYVWWPRCRNKTGKLNKGEEEGTLRTEEKLSACSISEKCRLHWFQSQSKVDSLLMMLLLLQRQHVLELLRILLEEEEEDKGSLDGREWEQPKPRTKLKWLVIELLAQHKGLNWETEIAWPTPQTLAIDISLSLSFTNTLKTKKPHTVTHNLLILEAGFSRGADSFDVQQWIEWPRGNKGTKHLCPFKGFLFYFPFFSFFFKNTKTLHVLRKSLRFENGFYENLCNSRTVLYFE